MSGFLVGERVSELGVLGCYAERVAVPVANGLRSPPPQRYPLSEAQAALQCPADGGVPGKLVLEP